MVTNAREVAFAQRREDAYVRGVARGEEETLLRLFQTSDGGFERPVRVGVAADQRGAPRTGAEA